MDRVEKLKEYLKTNDKDSFLQHALALEYIKVGDDAEAQKLFEDILQREPSYVGSYYHLGKLLERNESIDDAKQVYEKGMQKAKEAGDMHTYNELQTAYEDLVY